jgi:hypothetical protein
MELPTKILHSPDFKAQLDKISDNVIRTYKTGKLKPGQAWKRTPIDYLQENGLIYSSKLIEEFELISNRQSKLSSNVREYIKILVYQAINNTLVERQRNLVKEQQQNGKEK